MLARRGLILALALLLAAPAAASTERVVRLDASQPGRDNRAVVVGFARAHIGEVIGLKALVPMHVVVGSDADREVLYGYEGPQGRTLLHITAGFTLQGAVRHNQWHLERTYLVDGFFRVTDRGSPTTENGQELALTLVDQPQGAVETITDFAD
jgi:hypothetical protein